MHPTGYEPWVTHDRRITDKLKSMLKEFDDKLSVQWWNIPPPDHKTGMFRLLRLDGGKYHHIAWFDMSPGKEENLLRALREADSYRRKTCLTNKDENIRDGVRELMLNMKKSDRLNGMKAQNDASDFADYVSKDKTGVIYSYRR